MKNYQKILIISAVIFISALAVFMIAKVLLQTFGEKQTDGYLSSKETEVQLYQANEKKEKTEALTFSLKNKEVRGTKVVFYEKEYKWENKTLIRIKIKNSTYYVEKENTITDSNKIIKETEIYVRTPAVIYYKTDDSSILASTKKGEKLTVEGYSSLKKDGTVDMYKVSYKEKQGYIYGKYVVLTQEEALLNYNEKGIYDIHQARTDKFGGGNGGSLDYYPVEKDSIKGNEMPKETRTLYINASVVEKIDDYILFAKDNNINAFVIDIKENTVPAYASPVMSELSPSNYKKAVNTFDNYKKYIKKAKDAGIYVIGRITTFKDQYYAVDHKEDAILDTRNGTQFSHNGTYWPTAFSRNVWEYNVRLAVEAVKEMDFQEIQFDYVRFPDGTGNLEKSGAMDLRNSYGEEKAVAIQNFLLYAKDELRKVGAYISADVFGESASDYVTAYGQYWPAISNVVDVISAMPYPDHFNKNEYGISSPVWTIPYTLLKTWGTNSAAKRQAEIPTPATVRTWIQAYNSIKEPYVVYDANKVSEQIKGLYESGLTGGYITWNAGSSLDKYKQIAPAFKKEYINE
ncbi:MAG: putative glycoside hydrolase [Bacilli bacterium]|nr:putative glycoside hydrolase [Bacilli bacterium]